MTSPSVSSLLPSTLDSLSASSDSFLSAVLWGCSVPSCTALSRFDFDAALSRPALLVPVDPKETLDCCVLNTFSVLLSGLEKEDVVVVVATVPELWKVRSVLHPPSGVVVKLFRGTLSSSVAAILSSFLKCLASLELKIGEGSLRLLFVVVVCVGPVVFTERRVRMMEPFWAT